MVVIVEGRASLLLLDHGVEEVIADVGEGEIVGLLSTHRQADGLVARARTDCEVVTVDADVAGEIGSRNADLADALNRMATIRGRRVERILERRIGPDGAGTVEEQS